MFQLTELKSCVSGSKLQDLEPAAHFATAGTAATPWPRVQRGAVICNLASPPSTPPQSPSSSLRWRAARLSSLRPVALIKPT